MIVRFLNYLVLETVSCSLELSFLVISRLLNDHKMTIE